MAGHRPYDICLLKFYLLRNYLFIHIISCSFLGLNVFVSYPEHLIGCEGRNETEQQDHRT